MRRDTRRAMFCKRLFQVGVCVSPLLSVAAVQAQEPAYEGTGVDNGYFQRWHIAENGVGTPHIAADTGGPQEQRAVPQADPAIYSALGLYSGSIPIFSTVKWSMTLQDVWQGANEDNLSHSYLRTFVFNGGNPISPSGQTDPATKEEETVSGSAGVYGGQTMLVLVTNNRFLQAPFRGYAARARYFRTRWEGGGQSLRGPYSADVSFRNVRSGDSYAGTWPDLSFLVDKHPSSTGIRRVELRIQKLNGDDNGKWWNGNGWGVTQQPLLVEPVTPGSNVYRYTGNLPPLIADIGSAYQNTFEFVVSAYDAATEGGPTSGEFRCTDHTINFTVDAARDTTLPFISLASPYNNYSYPNASSAIASGQAYDNTGGSGLSRVAVRLFRYAYGGNPNAYWNGSAWIATTNPIWVNYSTYNASNKQWTYNMSFLGNTPNGYAIEAASRDQAGNVAYSGVVKFNVSGPAP